MVKFPKKLETLSNLRPLGLTLPLKCIVSSASTLAYGRIGSLKRIHEVAYLCDIGVPLQAQGLHKGLRLRLPVHGRIRAQMGIVVANCTCHLPKKGHRCNLHYSVTSRHNRLFSGHTVVTDRILPTFLLQTSWYLTCELFVNG